MDHEAEQKEMVQNLARKAQEILEQLNITNVSILVGDGSQGREEHSPHNGIVVTAGSPDFPKSLLNQLANGGRLVILVGDRSSPVQDLTSYISPIIS